MLCYLTFSRDQYAGLSMLQQTPRDYKLKTGQKQRYNVCNSLLRGDVQKVVHLVSASLRQVPPPRPKIVHFLKLISLFLSVFFWQPSLFWVKRMYVGSVFFG